MKKIIILSVGFFFALAFYSKEETMTAAAIKDEHKNNLTDSVQLAEYIKKLKFKYVEDSYEDVSRVIDWNEVDDLLLKQNTRCCDGTIFYAPDSLFKIYLIKSETCGIVCDPHWESYIVAKDNHKVYQSKIRFLSDIQNIAKLPDNKYLILQTSYMNVSTGKETSIVMDCRTAALISLKNDSLFFLPVLNKTTDKKVLNDFFNTNAKGLELCQPENFSTEKPFYNFDEKTNELNYGFGKRYRQNNTDSLVSGILVYKNGEFLSLKRSAVFVEHK
ncbi:MAG TPA: hypothetical protein VNW06_00335 [Cytophagaceae bacterium]|jgi:hypothetical protein|nr:hypothetical protein [Cytophagaceae bacterium]